MIKKLAAKTVTPPPGRLISAGLFCLVFFSGCARWDSTPKTLFTATRPSAAASDELAAAIRDLTTRPDEGRRRGEAGRQRLFECFAADRAAERWTQIVVESAAPNGPQSDPSELADGGDERR